MLMEQENNIEMPAFSRPLLSECRNVLEGEEKSGVRVGSVLFALTAIIPQSWGNALCIPS